MWCRCPPFRQTATIRDRIRASVRVSLAFNKVQFRRRRILGGRGTPPILVKGSRDPSVKSQRHISILISTQFDSAPGHLSWFFCTQDCRHVHNHYWSGAFNLLKFDRTPKKKNFAAARNGEPESQTPRAKITAIANPLSTRVPIRSQSCARDQLRR